MLFKRLSLVMVLCLAGLLSACGSDGSGETATEQSSTSEAAGTETKSEASTESADEAVKEKSLDDLAAYLVEKGVATGEKTETMYQVIGAVGGFKYLDSDVEVYEYDMESEAYKAIAETGEYSGLKFAAVNEQFVLLITNDGENQEAADIFNAY